MFRFSIKSSTGHHQDTYSRKTVIPSYTPKYLYKGIVAPMIGIFLEKAVVFGIYNCAYKETQNVTVSGAGAGLVASFVVTPYERIKILLQKGNSFKMNYMITDKFIYWFICHIVSRSAGFCNIFLRVMNF